MYQSSSKWTKRVRIFFRNKSATDHNLMATGFSRSQMNLDYIYIVERQVHIRVFFH